jgi:hypothetical protein
MAGALHVDIELFDIWILGDSIALAGNTLRFLYASSLP